MFRNVGVYACTICNSSNCAEHKYIFCSHSVCDACARKMNTCPYCRTPTGVDNDIASYLTCVLDMNDAEHLAQVLSSVTQKLKNNHADMLAADCTYLEEWLRCAPFISQGVTGVRTLLANQRSNGSCHTQRYPLWFFLYKTKDGQSFEAFIKSIYDARKSPKQVIIAHLTEDRLVHARRKLQRISEESSSQCRSRQLDMEIELSMIQGQRIMSKKSHSEFMYEYIITVDRFWHLAAEMDREKAVEEETINLLRDYMAAEMREDSNTGFGLVMQLSSMLPVHQLSSH